MKIIIWCPGRIKEKWLREGEEKYREYISKYVKLSVVESKEVSGEMDFVKKADANRAMEFLKRHQDALKVLLDEKGDIITTLSLAKFIESAMLSGKDIVFVIGGPFGFEDSFKRSSLFDKIISMSGMTLSHEFVRVILMEQIFRCMKIIRGERYHY